MQILEAGCGQEWPINLDQTNYLLTGVDCDKAALAIRKNVQRDIPEAIEGNLCLVRLGESRFDVIYNSFVLEHVKDVGKVLQNFSKWLKPHGLLIIKMPDPDSVRGFLTRITPHWFHIFYYKYLLGNPNAGKPGYAPYVTFFHPLVSRNGIYRFCSENHFLIREERGTAATSRTAAVWFLSLRNCWCEQSLCSLLENSLSGILISYISLKNNEMKVPVEPVQQIGKKIFVRACLAKPPCATGAIFVAGRQLLVQPSINNIVIGRSPSS